MSLAKNETCEDGEITKGLNEFAKVTFACVEHCETYLINLVYCGLILIACRRYCQKCIVFKLT